MNIERTVVHRIPRDNKIRRAGIILYHHDGNSWLFGLGVDRRTDQLTDFGGGVRQQRTGETAAEGGLREFGEETLGIFGTVPYRAIRKCRALCNRHQLLIFLKSRALPELVNSLFTRARRSQRAPEVAAIVWITWTELVTSADVFAPVLELLRTVEDPTQWLQP